MVTRLPHSADTKLVSVWRVTNPNMPGLKLLEICDAGSSPSGLDERDDVSELVLQYLQQPDDDAEELDDLVLTALQVQSWSIASVIHSARAAKRCAQQAERG